MRWASTRAGDEPVGRGDERAPIATTPPEQKQSARRSRDRRRRPTGSASRGAAPGADAAMARSAGAGRPEDLAMLTRRLIRPGSYGRAAPASTGLRARSLALALLGVVALA